MPKRGENIYKRKDGRWEGRYIRGRNLNGKVKYGYVYAGNYREVKAKLLQLKAKIDEEHSDLRVNKECVLGEVLDAWLRYISINVKESTQARYEYVVEHYIRPALGTVDTKKLTTIVVEKFVQSLLYEEDGKTVKLSEKSVNDILVIVKTIIKYGNLRGYQIPCCTEGLHIKTTARTRSVLEPADQKLLTKWLMTDRDLCKLGVLICLYTGIRLGELCALKWKHILLEEGVLQVFGTMQRVSNANQLNRSKTKIIVDTPKTQNSHRNIPLPNFLLDYIANFRGDPESYVLTGERTRFIEPRLMQYRFKSYLKQCEIPYVNFHTLRHTFATRCIELGFDVKSLSEILGHANVSITLNKYVHSSMNLKRENMEMLSAII